MRRLVRKLPELTPEQYARVTLVALVALTLVVLTGAAVRLTGSGLGCPNWPKCGDGFIAPLEGHAWIEFGNRLYSGLVGLVAIVAGLLAFRRRPFRRDLAILGTLPALGVLVQGVLGGLTVKMELHFGFVMGHFLLSMLLLIPGVLLFWRARTDPPDPGEPTESRRVVIGARLLLIPGAIAIFMGTVATAAGPHAGSGGTGEVVPRLELLNLDALIHWHGRTGTVLGISAVVGWFLARRWGAGPSIRRALTTLCLLVAAQGIVGFAQYELQLPASLVWLHIVLATATWLAILFAVAAAGPLPAAESATVERSSTPGAALPKTG